MNPPAPAPTRRSPLFWVLGGVGATVALCCCLGTGMALLADDAKAPGATSAASSGAIPTGDTPNLYPGMPGWLPSGHGVEIPSAEVAGGRPLGLWWYPQLRTEGMAAMIELYLADGTYAARPRPGGPLTFDLEGQRRLPGSNGVGTFEVSDGKITQTADGFTHTDAFSEGDDGEGPWFNAGAGRRRPISPISREALVGSWRGAGSRYRFGEDGSVEVGFLNDVAVGTTVGTFVLDGYLLQIKPANAPSWVTLVGSTVEGTMLIIGTHAYQRGE